MLFRFLDVLPDPVLERRIILQASVLGCQHGLRLFFHRMSIAKPCDQIVTCTGGYGIDSSLTAP